MMLLISQQSLRCPPSQFSLYFGKNPSLSVPIASGRKICFCPPDSQILRLKTLEPHYFTSITSHKLSSHLRAYESDGAGERNVTRDFNLDYFLSFTEFCCLFSSAILSVGFVTNSLVSGSKKEVFVAIGNRVLLWSIFMLVGGVIVGAWIRKRQWRRICRETVKGGLEVNLLERIEKLEEDLKSSATIIRVLSRQLEKLGIRFRVTRKALKEPIAETAALARKNSEATRALAVQEDILEKELGEIQKVLLAMQEQQQKQLELILAIGKTSKLWESRQESNGGHDSLETSISAEDVIKEKETHQI